MNFELNNIIRDNIKRLTAYSSAREDFTEQAEIFLDANENPYDNGINRYPDPFQKNLKAQISKIKGVDTEKIFLGNGSDEVLDIAMRIFCEPKQDNIIICPPTYGMYKVLADINNIETKEVLLDTDFSIQTNKILEAANASTKIVIVCSPNNPTGNSIPNSEIEILLNQLNCMVLVDEAYVDFSDKESAVNLINKYPNLIVSQTLSKAYGMAGIRVGIALSQPVVLEVFNKVKPPYNINVLSQTKALKNLLEEDLYKERLLKISEQKEILITALQQNKSVENVFQSDANFLMVRFNNAKKTYNFLIKEGLVVRNRSTQPLCDNCLRITIGTEQETKILIEKLNMI